MVTRSYRINQAIFIKSSAQRLLKEPPHIEHIVPESLGGLEKFTLSNGMVCNKCNAYFSKIEGKALNDFPFKILRVLFGVPTKKGNQPKLSTISGTISAPPGGGQTLFDMNIVGNEGFLIEGNTSIYGIFLAEMYDKLSICKLLIKMGIELVALRFPELVNDQRYTAGKEFARFGKRGSKWDFIIEENLDETEYYLKNGIDNNVFSLELYGADIPSYFAYKIAGYRFHVPIVDEHNVNKIYNSIKMRMINVEV